MKKVLRMVTSPCHSGHSEKRSSGSVGVAIPGQAAVLLVSGRSAEVLERPSNCTELQGRGAECLYCHGTGLACASKPTTCHHNNTAHQSAHISNQRF
jgi:hypothetical protein